MLSEVGEREAQRRSIYERNWRKAWDRVAEEASVILALADVVTRRAFSDELHRFLDASEPQDPGVLPAKAINNLDFIKARFSPVDS